MGAFDQILPMLLQLPLSAANSLEQGLQTWLANQANLERYGQGLNELEMLRRRVGENIRPTAAAFSSAWGRFPDQVGQRYANLISQAMPGFDRITREAISGNRAVLQQFPGFRNEAIGGAEAVQRAAEERHARILRNLEGAGAQERRDINTRFGNLQSQNLTDLTNRGLAGTVVLPGMRAGIERERSDALGGLEERIRQQVVNTDAALSGDVINAMQAGNQVRYGTGLDWMNAQNSANQFAYGANLSTQNFMSSLLQQQANAELNAAQASLQNRWILDTAPWQYDFNTTFPIVNWIGNRQDTAPSESNFLQQQYTAGLSSGPPIDYPSPNSNSAQGFLGPLFGGLGFGGGAALGTAAFGGGAGGFGALGAKVLVACIGAHNLVQTDRGPHTLWSVRVGDMVMAVDGTYRRVVRKDIGIMEFPRGRKMLILKTDRGGAVEITSDHEIGGRPAIDYQIGDPLPDESKVIGISSSAALIGADLELDGADGYLVGGVPVDSMLSKKPELVDA